VGDVILRETFRVKNRLTDWYIGNFMEKLPVFWNMIIPTQILNDIQGTCAVLHWTC